MTIRIAHLSDIHVNHRGRVEDLKLVLDFFLEKCKQRAVDLIVISGDLYERRSVPEERTFLAEFLQRAAEIAPVAGCRGNHDAPGDLEVMNRLETKYPLFIAERPTAAPGSAWTVAGPRGHHFGVLALPWVDKAHMAAGLDATAEAAAVTQQTIAAVRDLLTCLHAEAQNVRRRGAVPVLVTHVMLGGSVVSSGQILIGQGVELSPSDLMDVGCTYAACGHVHASQEWFGGRVAYAGNPERHDYGEKEAKGFRLVTLTAAGDFVSNEFVELPARPMVLIEVDWTTAEGVDRSMKLGLDGDPRLRGARVRLRYRIKPQDLALFDEVKTEKILLAAGAHEVKLEAVVEAETRVRSAEIVDIQSLPEKVDAFWRAKGIDVDEPTRDRVHGKLADLEAR